MTSSCDEIKTNVQWKGVLSIKVWVLTKHIIIEGLRAKRAYIPFLANFHFLQDRANFWQTDLF